MRGLYIQSDKLFKDVLIIFRLKSKGKLKLEKNNFTFLILFFIVQHSLYSDNLHTRVLKLIYLKHNTDLFITNHCLFKF